MLSYDGLLRPCWIPRTDGRGRATATGAPDRTAPAVLVPSVVFLRFPGSRVGFDVAVGVYPFPWLSSWSGNCNEHQLALPNHISTASAMVQPCPARRQLASIWASNAPNSFVSNRASRPWRLS